MAEAARPGLTELVASLEPAVVFASLAASCVPQLCDRCEIEILEDGGGRYRVSYPPADQATGRSVGGVVDPSARQLSLPFDGDTAEGARAYWGTAVFTWLTRTPSSPDAVIAELIIERAVRTVAWQHSAQQARDAATTIQQMQEALGNSRQIGAAIGILMSLHKVTEDAAFALLRNASSRTNRKLRDIALDVLDTGCLDLVAPPAGPPHRKTVRTTVFLA